MGAVKDFFLSLAGRSKAHLEAQAKYNASAEELDRKSAELDALLSQIGNVEKTVVAKKDNLNRTMGPSTIKDALTEEQRKQLVTFRSKMPSEQGT